MLSTWKIAPALAAGCTVVHKPAELAPLTARLLVEIAEEAGLPKGVLNVVNGFGETAGQALTRHPDVKAIAFVGESRTGADIMRQGADTLKRVHFELGGKNPVIVFDDADLDRALDAVVFMIYSLNGERCTSSSRLLVQETIAEKFIERVADRASRIRTGNPLDPATELGPLIHEQHLDKVASYFDIARQEGARIVVGGKRIDASGCFVAPTLIADAAPGMRVSQEEIFGPVLTAMTFGDENEAISVANGVRYGLSAYVWTQSLETVPPRLEQAGSRNDLGQFRKCPALADAVRRHKGKRHRARRRRLVIRILHGAETCRLGSRRASHSEARQLNRRRIRDRIFARPLSAVQHRAFQPC